MVTVKRDCFTGGAWQMSCPRKPVSPWLYWWRLYSRVCSHRIRSPALRPRMTLQVVKLVGTLRGIWGQVCLLQPRRLEAANGGRRCGAGVGPGTMKAGGGVGDEA